MNSRGHMDLSALEPGESAIITDIRGEHEVTLRLLDLGFLEGRIVAMRHHAPFGGTIAVEVAGTVVALGPQEAALIRVAQKEVIQ